MDMGNDLLFYESRKRAIERVKKMQEESQKRISEGEAGEDKVYFDQGVQNREKGKSSDHINGNYNGNNNFSNFQNGYNTSGYGQYNNGGNYQGRNNSFDTSNNRRGLSSFLENFTNGNGNTLNFLKGQIGEITGPLKGIMDYLDLDSEKLIIIMVMWMLFNEKADKTLLLALGYLLL